MEFSERELEDWVYENPEAIGVDEWVGRQLSLPSGILDLVGVRDSSEPGSLILLELKAVPITSSAVLQVCRYAADLMQLPGVDDVEKVCVGVGSVSRELQYAADAVDVSLKTVEPEFSISGSWCFTEERLASDAIALESLADNTLWFKRLKLSDYTRKGLMAALKGDLYAPESLLVDLAREYEINYPYLLKQRADFASRSKPA